MKLKDLILLHGALGFKGQFDALASVLKENRRVHALNFSGHGGKEFHPHGYDFDVFAEDIQRYIKQNHIEEADIFGYSMGGYAALYCTSLFPEKIRSVFTLGTKFKWDRESASVQAALLDDKKISEKVPKFAAYLRDNHAPNDWTKVLAETKSMMHSLAEGKSRLDHEKINAAGKKILLSIGDKDDVSSIGETLETRVKLKEARLLVLPGTPHPLEKVNTGMLAFHIRNFIDE